MSDELLNRILAPGATFYDILGVSTDATIPQVRSAYKKIAVKVHPDKYNGPRTSDASKAFILISDALDTLCDEALRTTYNAHLFNEGTGTASSASTGDTRPAGTEPPGGASTTGTGPRSPEADATPPPRTRFDPHPGWSDVKRTLHAFWLFMAQTESDLKRGENADEAGVGVVVLGSIALLKEGGGFVAANPELALFISVAALVYYLVTTPEQRDDHMAGGRSALNWDNWSRDAKLQVV